jgi:hypothetical protein
VCKFNTGAIKTLDVFPIIQHHKHLAGVESLLDEKVFRKVRIGEFGEIVWDKIVETEQEGILYCWDYDISPEYAFQNAINN